MAGSTLLRASATASSMAALLAATAALSPVLTACAAHNPVAEAPALAPTSTDRAQAAVRGFFDRTYADQSTLRYSFAPLILSQVHIAGITERGYFLCGTVAPIAKAQTYVGQQVFFTHFNPLRHDVVDNASVQPSGPSETRALCGQAYGGANVPLGDVVATP